eukprot:671943_1
MSALQARLAEMGITINASLFPNSEFRYPVIGVLLYLLTVVYFQPAKSTTKSKSKAPKKKTVTKLKLFMFVHNMLLCVFSAMCCYNTAPIVAKVFMNGGFDGALCDKSLENLYSKGVNGVFGYWCYLFYWSKYYEFIDTFIVIARGRRPIFLQTFHHCGAVFGMWAVLVTSCTGGYLFVCFNSCIHTAMYFYYAMSSINIRVPGKFILTRAQMIQFVIGNSIALVQLLVYGDCVRKEDKAVIWYHILYTSFLFTLFSAFYQKTYKKKTKKKSG